MTLAPLDLISAHPWQRVTFTTYALSLSFFEAVILDALIRAGGREAMILADIDGVRASLSEQGAQRVGKDYEVEPISVSSGVFHPKISVLSGKDECHVLVGSGNLTFGGWGGNYEVLEHLASGFCSRRDRGRRGVLRAPLGYRARAARGACALRQRRRRSSRRRAGEDAQRRYPPFSQS